MSERSNAAAEEALFAVGIVVYVAFSVSFYAAAGHDDSFITLWAGRSLAEGRGFIDQNGTTVEIASSLLHVLVVAGLARIAPGLVFLGSKLVGLGCGLALLTAPFAFRDDLLGPAGRGRPSALGFSLLSLATCPFRLYRNLGALETPLQTLLIFLLACALAADRGRPVDSLGIVSVQTLCLLARPEGFIAALAVALYLLALPGRSRVSPRRAAVLVGIPAAAGISLGIWRFLAFGVPFPNPVSAKVGLQEPAAGLRAGLNDVAGCFTSGPFFVVLGGAVLLVLVLAVRNELVAEGPGPRLLRRVVVAAVLLLVATNVGGRAWPGRCSTQAGTGDLLGIRNAALLQQRLTSLNCAHGREERYLLPCLRASLRETARRHGGRLVVATVQTGFFPWTVRTEFPGLDVTFVDTFSVTDAHVARLDVPWGALGVAPGMSLGAVVDGGAGELLRFVREKGANLASAVEIPEEDRRRFVHAGWRLVRDRPGAVVFEAGGESGRRAEGRTAAAGRTNDGIEASEFL